MRFLLLVSRVIDVANTWIGRAAGWLLLVATVISAVNAIIRKFFSISSNAWLDAQWYLFGAAFLLCASYTLLKNEHVRVDLLSNKLSKRGRDLVDLFGHLFFLLPLTILMTVEGYPYARRSFLEGETSLNAGGLLVWPAKVLIVVGFALLMTQAISETIKRLAIVIGRLDDPAGEEQADSPFVTVQEESSTADETPPG